MNYGDKVTIGLPCYNVEPYLESCLNSILNQTYENWELIAIDDGSSDRTLEILKSFNDSRVSIVSDGVNKGLASRLNEIIRRANTDIVVRHDADDLMLPEKIAKQVTYLSENADCDMVGTAMLCVDNDLKPKATRFAPVLNEPLYQAFSGNFINHATVAGKREWFLAHPYDETLKISEDFDLWTATAGELKAFNLQEVLYVYREYGCLSYAKYRVQSAISKRCILKYGPSKIGFVKAYKFWLSRFCKDVIYWLLTALVGFDRALSMRNKSLSEVDEAHYEKVVGESLTLSK